MDEIGYLQEFAQQARTTAQNLRPFAIYMASVISIVDGRRSQIIELAPMEQICLEISTITPDSRQRIEAIEKVDNHLSCIVIIGGRIAAGSKRKGKKWDRT